jgi:Ca2+-binding RTX toxin-like protein
MPIPVTKIFLASSAAGAGGYTLLPQEAGDFALPGMGAFVAAMGDLNGDGIAEIVAGVPGNSDQSAGGGRVYITFGQAGGGGAIGLGDPLTQMRIDGAVAGDHVGSAIAGIGDQNGDAAPDLLIGALLAERGALVDAGAVYVVFASAAAPSVDLNDLGTAGSGEGFVIRGEAAGDRAGAALGAIGDLNGDGRADILVGAAGSNAGGADSGAAYVVWGRATDTPVVLTAATAGTAGFRIRGEAAGDAAGTALVAIADLNGDGLGEILLGAPGNDAGGREAGAAYVVFGKASGTEVNLDNIAIGVGGFRITGARAGDLAGMQVAALGDVNADGLADMLITASEEAFVVFGQAVTDEIKLSKVRDGIGGYDIRAEAAGDMLDMVVAGGGDLNRDGINDLVIGTRHNAEGGGEAGAVYVVWGGASSRVDLSAVAMGAGGAKIVGAAGSGTGASVAVVADMNGDAAADLVIGAPGAGVETVSVLYAPAAWQPDANVYGTNDPDIIDLGYGGLHVVGAGADSIYALDGADSIFAGGGGDVIDGGQGADTLAGGAGNDVYVVDTALDLVIEAAGEGADTVLSAVSYTLGTEVEALRLTVAGRTGTGNEGANALFGSIGADTLQGAGGADTLLGDAGNDRLDGGLGADSLVGGAGNDLYVLDEAGDVVLEAPAGGADTILSGIDMTLAGEIEALVLTGAARRGTGNAGANLLVGGLGDDSLDGGLGADTMVGSAGNDRYMVDDALDRVTELAGGGADTVVASVAHTLGAEVETLVLTGTARRGTGNALANRITGTGGADTLDGAGGADTLVGGANNDTYIVDSAGDVVVELAGGGRDTLVSALDATLGLELEALVLVGAARQGTGNAQANRITGSDGNDALAGLDGVDTLLGGVGNDLLDGGLGADSMAGGAGNDRYLVDTIGERTVEAAGGGIDTVVATLDWTLAAEVENLELAGAARRGIGNAGDNSLRGGAGDDRLDGMAGADTLDGGAGADTMAGGAGNDTYVITDPGDRVIESATGGFDTVIVSTDWTLATNIEAVQLLGSGHRLTGNAASNLLSGNSGADTLDGGDGDDVMLGGDGEDVLVSAAGADTLSGGAGDDRFEVHGGRAHVEDFLGHDTIDASDATGSSYIDLSGETDSEIELEICDFGQGGSAAGPLDLQFLQDLTGSFADDIATVRALVPQIVATLTTVQPDSTFGVSTFRDKPFGGFGGVGDWVYRQDTGLSKDIPALTSAYTAMIAANGADGPEAQIEALMHLALHVTDIGFRTNSARFVVLFTDAPFHAAGDGAAAGIATPNNGDGVLDGVPPGTGEDYPAIAQLRTALEAANIIPIFCVAGGNDAAYLSLVDQLGRGAEVTLSADSSNVVAAITAGLTAVTRTSVEDAWGGAGADTLRGNDAANALEGRAGDDSLAGGLGADTLSGGAGNDCYVVEDARDDIRESALGGTDRVEAWVDWTLAAEVETLLLRGGAIHGTGNALANLLATTDAGGWLEGLDGRDTLRGGLGADTLDGGLGADSMAGGAGDDTYRVDDALDRILELAGGGTDTVISTRSMTLRAEFEVLRLEGGALNGTGNAGANALYGTAGVNQLSGLDGDDLLVGDAGADVLKGGNGADTLDGGAGADKHYGGAGADVFLFAALPDAADRIYDFAALDDTIALSAAGFGGGLAAKADVAAGNLLVFGNTATAAHGQFLYEQALGRLSWDVDGTGATGRVMVAVLSAAPVLDATDLHIIA